MSKNYCCRHILLPITYTDLSVHCDQEFECLQFLQNMKVTWDRWDQQLFSKYVVILGIIFFHVLIVALKFFFPFLCFSHQTWLLQDIFQWTLRGPISTTLLGRFSSSLYHVPCCSLYLFICFLFLVLVSYFIVGMYIFIKSLSLFFSTYHH